MNRGQTRSSGRGGLYKQAARLGALFFFVAGAVPGVQAQTPVPQPLAEVNGDTITLRHLEQAAGAKLFELEEQLYEFKRRELDGLIADRLFAQESTKRGISVSALLDAEITAKVPLVTEQEIDAFYEANKTRIRGDAASARQQIRTHLQQQKLLARRAEFVESLKSQSKIVTHLPPPRIIRLDIRTEGAPSRGAAEAPITLVEFSDFHCPFCKQSQATLKQLLERYSGKVKLVYRDFPLDQLHPQARAAAEAARCANDQGKFWQYHDVLFQRPPDAAPQVLRTYAEQIGLDAAAFDRCLTSGIHREAVDRDVEDAARLGLTGTPAFFINGRPLTGAQPLEAFVRIIEDELKLKDDARTGKR